MFRIVLGDLPSLRFAAMNLLDDVGREAVEGQRRRSTERVDAQARSDSLEGRRLPPHSLR